MAEAPPSQFLDVRGVRTHVRERGAGAPLLLLHGAGGPGPWRPYQDALAQRFRVIAPDHPGFGASDRPDWLEAFQRDMQFGILVPLLQFGTLPHDVTVKNMELFAREVMPHLRPLGQPAALTA